MSVLRVHRLAAAALLSLALSPSAGAKDVYIAIAGPMTGSTAALGAQIRDGAAAAVDSINASGLLLDTRLILRIADDACDPKQAVAVANRLTSDGIKLVVGHFCSSSSISASDIYAEAEVIQISPGSTNSRLTERGLTTLFRICGRDDQQGRVAADYIVRHHQGAKLAVLDDKSTAGKGIADIVESRLRVAGEHPVRQSYVAGERDYAALVSRLKREGIQLVYIGGYYNEIGLIVRQAAEAGARLTVIANDPLMTTDFLAIAGDAAKGTLFTFMPDPTKNGAGAAVVAKLQGSSLSAAGYTLYAYAAVQAWANSVKRAGTFDAMRVAAALRSDSIETAIGTVRFDSKGDNAAPGFIVYRWRDNIVEAVEQN
ncbi:branched-chain amino acid ABC transporter substrate-binding protein [Bradyrhizobium canariense]|uniref:Branched chain amino acid ABC transporter substrate-binding protein n=1 Tax=Bradyrhizobium canariense TaxID=255045 RepID=A0A1X3FWE4_9BRAD|nr:branched-chain amino acid ABC transporter substrate-binding protein [Bradyrhizobium canariense]OSI71079.1 branched chain amino acid ABC transporter substrate-binding protein [Bradyrhizobium canariense]OSI79585.1 branched chain amino acid ABC transporter substrate-binding protein [Bradyrhizobium canariense]OSI91268.1 branched chain amino acid ABC transporter substrate-binding protein [Bradyrhizobium canariense]OSI91892.1 branched chain amino acid ABC transporter substrate-binding protein [Bra